MGGSSEPSARDLDLVLQLVTDRYEDAAADDALPWRLLAGVKQLIPSAGLSAFEMDAHQRSVSLGQQVPDDNGDGSGPEDDIFWAHYWDDLSCCYPDRTGDVHSVTKTTDFYSVREMRNTPMYQEYVKKFGLMHDLMLCLPAGPGRTHRVLLWREPGCDFSERDRALLILLRPHLLAAYRRSALRRQAGLDLTDRQWQLLRQVAAGHTNAQIARRLGVSEGTVRKHLENIFQRMGVASRTAAVVRAFPGEHVG